MPGFDDLGLSSGLVRSLREMGFEEPTPVQAAAIPFLQQGRDVVAQALTGTGKTAAYGIPLLERLRTRMKRPQAVVLAPTRELAVQIAEHLAQLARHMGDVRILPVYGGQPIERQLRALGRGAHVVVATPGRLMDHMRRGSVNLSDVTMLVLDEADQMLQMGFQEDVEYVVSHLQAERQTALFSATMPQPILDIVNNYMRSPEMVRLSKPRQLTVPAVEQTAYQVPFPRKFDALARLLDVRNPDRTIVFCATKRMVDEVVERLPARGYAAEALHGDISQAGRERVLQKFRQGHTEVLVATDVAARGLDVPDVSLVINFDIPPDPEYYVHRIGRTARSGRSGEAITLVNPREMRELQVIERVTGARITRRELPTMAEAQVREAQVLEERLLDVLQRGGWQQYLGIVEELGVDNDPAEVAAAALALAAEARPSSRRQRTPVAAQPSEPAEQPAGRTPRPAQPSHVERRTGFKPPRPRKAFGHKAPAKARGRNRR